MAPSPPPVVAAVVADGIVQDGEGRRGRGNGEEASVETAIAEGDQDVVLDSGTNSDAGPEIDARLDLAENKKVAVGDDDDDDDDAPGAKADMEAKSSPGMDGETESTRDLPGISVSRRLMRPCESATVASPFEPVWLRPGLALLALDLGVRFDRGLPCPCRLGSRMPESPRDTTPKDDSADTVMFPLLTALWSFCHLGFLPPRLSASSRSPRRTESSALHNAEANQCPGSQGPGAVKWKRDGQSRGVE
ncbi:hypothetical protein VDGL01_08979 [Verticillium dahliae]